MLTTYVQRPSMKHCQMVAESLILKFSFLKESVSEKLNISIFKNECLILLLEFMEAFHVHTVSEH